MMFIFLVCTESLISSPSFLELEQAHVFWPHGLVCLATYVLFLERFPVQILFSRGKLGFEHWLDLFEFSMIFEVLFSSCSCLIVHDSGVRNSRPTWVSHHLCGFHGWYLMSKAHGKPSYSPKAKGVFPRPSYWKCCARSNIGKKVARPHLLWTLGFCFSQNMILRQVRPAVA